MSVITAGLWVALLPLGTAVFYVQSRRNRRNRRRIAELVERAEEAERKYDAVMAALRFINAEQQVDQAGPPPAQPPAPQRRLHLVRGIGIGVAPVAAWIGRHPVTGSSAAVALAASITILTLAPHRSAPPSVVALPPVDGPSITASASPMLASTAPPPGPVSSGPTASPVVTSPALGVSSAVVPALPSVSAQVPVPQLPTYGVQTPRVSTPVTSLPPAPAPPTALSPLPARCILHVKIPVVDVCL